jgi:cytochrome b pre-mRNA-processing protein 3
MIFSRLFREPKLRTDARALYDAAVLQARTPAFYADHGVPDTVDGRFDMVVLHVWLMLRHFRTAPDSLRKQRDAVAQAVFDEMVRDFDRNVREIGISDVRVGKHMKTMAKAFYGRIAAYDEALAEDQMADALKRNLFGKVDTVDEDLDQQAGTVADYVKNQVEFIAGQGFVELFSGKIMFSDQIGAQSR